MSTPTTIRDACPVCEDANVDLIARIAYVEIWSRFERDFGVVIPPAVRAANMPGEGISLVRCSTCSLERFDPLLPGDTDFYAALMSSVPYTVDRWDFRTARDWIVGSDDVLDLGCGEGRFLESLGARAGRTAGVDHHGPAIARFVERGGEGFEGTFEAFAETHAGSFDVVTSFHTLEHVAAPLQMLRAAATCLRPDGMLFVSVPNRERAWREEGEPMDRPPHHVTRWGPEQIVTTAERAGMRVGSLSFEPPDLSVARALIERSASGRLPGRIRPLAALPARIYSMLAMPASRHRREVQRGVFAARGIYGHSLLAVLRSH